MRGSRDISLNQLIYFVRSAELSSMTEAAASLYIAQSAISTSIANLESTLGTTLFIRKRAKGLVLTASGQHFLTRVRRILADLDDAVDELAPDALTGRFTAGCFPTIAPFYLPDIVHGMAQKHPQLELDIVELGPQYLEEALRHRAIEVAITYDLALGSDIHREILGRVPLYAAFARDHRLANAARVTAQDLVDEPMILLDLPASREYFIRAFTSVRAAPPIRYRFSSFEAVRAMVARGHGFTLLNQKPASNTTYDGSELAVVPFDSDVAPLEVVMASLSPLDQLTTKARAFTEQCRLAVATTEPAPVEMSRVQTASVS